MCLTSHFELPVILRSLNFGISAGILSKTRCRAECTSQADFKRESMLSFRRYICPLVTCTVEHWCWGKGVFGGPEISTTQISFIMKRLLLPFIGVASFQTIQLQLHTLQNAVLDWVQNNANNSHTAFTQLSRVCRSPGNMTSTDRIILILVFFLRLPLPRTIVALVMSRFW